MVSLDQAWEDKSANIRRISAMMPGIARQSPDLVVFPEMTLTGFTMNGKGLSEDFNTGMTLRYFKGLARLHEVDIAFGMIQSCDLMPTNNLVLVTGRGEVPLDYAKMHPFSYSGEDMYYRKGDGPGIFEYKGCPMGGTICYDLRFPELYQALSKRAKVILNIANWPKRRVNDWRLLLHARALENQVIMIGVNRTGIDGNNVEYEKSSMVVGPDGKDIKPFLADGAVDCYDIDLSIVDECRASFPVKKDRRIDLYKKIL